MSKNTLAEKNPIRSKAKTDSLAYWKNVWTRIQRKVILDLLRGNDSCCFTTEQYKKKYLAGWKSLPKDFESYLTEEIIEGHLNKFPDLIVCVKPGLWRAV